MQPHAQTPEEAVLRALRQRRQGAVLVYTGPAGVGKTHAARELLRRAAVRSYSLSATLPLAEWPARLPAPRGLPAWADHALRQPGGDGGLSALAALIAALAPTGLQIDDLHDAPGAQVTALSTLAGLLSNARGVALLFTSRQSAPAGLPSCEVQPLDEAGTAQLTAQELGAGVPAEVSTWIYTHARGNPLFTLEYLRYLARSGHLYSDGQRWHWRPPGDARVPGRVEALIDLTLGRAGEHRPLLDARACVPDAEPEVWAQVAGVSADGLTRGAAALQDQGLLTPPGASFSHPLYPEVLRARQTPEQRRSLARRALQAYRADPLRAVDFLDEAGLTPAEAGALLEQAAAQAERGGQGQRAGLLLARASDLDTGGRQPGLALRAAGLLHTTDLPRALELARRALDDPALVGEALPLAAALSARTGGRDVLEAVLAKLPAGPPGEAPGLPNVRLLNVRIVALQGVGDHAGVVELWAAADETQRAQADVQTERAVAISLLAVGRQEDAALRLAALLERALSGAERLQLRGVQVMLLYHQGEYRAAADLAGETAGLLEAAGNLVGAGALYHNRAAFLRMLGEFGDAMFSVRRALELRRRLGDPRGYASSLGMLGELELERGELDAAEDALSEALGVLTYLDGAHFLLNTLCMLTYLYTLSDAPLSASLALHHAGRALTAAHALGNPRLLVETLADASRAHTRAGDPRTGLELAEDAAARAAALSSDHRTQARNAVARGLALEGLGRAAEALEALRDAEHLARAHQGEYEADRIALDIARLCGDQAALERLAATFEARSQGLGALLARRALGGPLPVAGRAPELRVLGPLELGSGPVRGERRRALLLRLLEARLSGRAEVTRLDLADELYPDRPEAQALGALKQAVAALRAAAGRGVIQTTPGGYALGPVSSDAEAFLARPELGLWRGPLPPDTGEALREALSRALLTCAQQALDSDPAACARAGRLLLEADPLDSAALRLTLQALRQEHNHRSLARVYASAREAHAGVGVALPERWQDYLARTEG
ncbi:tetratricopeptide repeat protein [Deinococcus koreensis]|uniref:Uncharacterized protein n=1 Tax=Deinococcus koreensis TaxID=2054903 RepID=A0A2K3UZR5_9DEIO|nr:tetratricopeptide repeat protein [Deinococcus koreensis]PNY82021.1 hypothetical protein CVO96_12165 [Deinococcus koreensis]